MGNSHKWCCVLHVCVANHNKHEARVVSKFDGLSTCRIAAMSATRFQQCDGVKVLIIAALCRMLFSVNAEYMCSAMHDGEADSLHGQITVNLSSNWFQGPGAKKPSISYPEITSPLHISYMIYSVPALTALSAKL